MMNFNTFTKYDDHSPKIPVYLISSGDKPASHRFYDTNPISPSGLFITYTEFETDTILPRAGDKAHVIVKSLSTGEECFRRATIAWDTQLGAQAQWGIDDTELYFNDMNELDWTPFGLKCNIFTNDCQKLSGTIYMVSPKGDYAASPNLLTIGLVQPGYGVHIPQDYLVAPKGASEADGLFITDLHSGESRLLVSFAKIYSEFKEVLNIPNINDGAFYGFHVKWSPDASRIMFIIRWLDSYKNKKHSKNWMITMRSDGSEMCIALDADRWRGGHHPNWCPNSTDIIMNLMFHKKNSSLTALKDLFEKISRRLKIRYYSNDKKLQLCKFKFDGSGLKVFAGSFYGSGHPTFNSKLNAVLTDAYPNEIVSFGDGTVPIRLISDQHNFCETLIRVHTDPVYSGPRQEWRVDPHPAWNKSEDIFIFNAFAYGVRQVFLADMRGYNNEQ